MEIRFTGFRANLRCALQLARRRAKAAKATKALKGTKEPIASTSNIIIEFSNPGFDSQGL